MVISLRISDELVAMVDEEAKRRKWSRNATINHLIEYGLPDSEREPVRGEACDGAGVPVRSLKGGGITQRGRAQTAVQIGKSEEDSKAVQVRPTPSVQIPESLRGKLKVASELESPVDENEALGVEMCPYTEYDPESGETYRCARGAHGPKVKHTRGERV
jgi:hypothetical protein